MTGAAPLLASVLVAVGVLGGCTTSSQPPTATVTSPSPTPTMPAPVPSPAKPADWADNGDAGARAAAVWFVRDAYQYVYETNDLTDWTALSHPDCVFCKNVSTSVTDNAQNKFVARQDVPAVTVTRTEELNPLAYSVLVSYAQRTSQYYTTGGVWVSSGPASTGQLLLVLNRVGPDWQLREG